MSLPKLMLLGQFKITFFKIYYFNIIFGLKNFKVKVFPDPCKTPQNDTPKNAEFLYSKTIELQNADRRFFNFLYSKKPSNYETSHYEMPNVVLTTLTSF